MTKSDTAQHAEATTATGHATVAARRVFVVGATGTIGRATVRALVAQGHAVTCFVRRQSVSASHGHPLLDGADIRFGDVTDPHSIRTDGFRGERFDAVVSCLASRSGTPRDARAIDYEAHLLILAAAKDAGVRQMVLLSAICVQKPLLAFQQEKLAFEQTLIASGLVYSIVRPTAFFKSLSGQLDRVRRGKPFLIFGDGKRTACKPISDDDLANYLAACLVDERLWNRVLPIGGPGDAITPLQQGELLFAAVGRAPKYKRVPVGFLRMIQQLLSLGGRLSPALANKAELAKIGLYYATESMLVLDPVTGRYDASATPSYGKDTLSDYYRRLSNGDATDDRGAHAVF